MLTLPAGDQAAMGLVIHAGNNAPEVLPYDEAGNRSVVRRINAALDTNGTFRSTVFSTRTGIEAAHVRADYRYLSMQKRINRLHEGLVQDYPDIAIDTFQMTGLDTLCDSVKWLYAFSAKNTVSVSGSTAIFPLHLPGSMQAGEFAAEEKRQTPADFSKTSLGANSQSLHAELTIPEKWKRVTLPAPVRLRAPFGSYSITFRQNGRTILCDRNAVFSMNKPITAAQYPEVRNFLNGIAKADDVRLVFFTK